MQLENKIAVVTGSSKGIGKAIAIAFAKEGANVVVNYHSDEIEAKKVVREIQNIGQKSISVRADVSKHGEAEQLISKALEKFGRIDILVNNVGGAGRIPEGTFLDMPMDYWRKQIEKNLNSAVYCSQLALKDMISRREGRIINISSIHSAITFTTGKTLPYAVAKAALNMFTNCLAVEMAPYNININCIAPGFIATPLTKSRYGKREITSFLKRIPMGRRGRPKEVAGVAVFLASDASSYITGKTLFVDGGWLGDGTLYDLANRKAREGENKK